MEDIRLSLNDEYKVEDRICPKGVVIIRDEDGNILFKGNNMVVKSGRTLIFDLFCQSGTKKFSDLKAFIGDNSTMAAANDEFSGYTEITSTQAAVSLSGSYKRKVTIDNTTSLQTVTTNKDDFMVYYNSSNARVCPDQGKLYYIIDPNKLYIHMGINYTPAQAISASTFGLYFNNSGNKLFSRIVFPRRILASNTPLIIDYYLYF